MKNKLNSILINYIDIIKNMFLILHTHILFQSSEIMKMYDFDFVECYDDDDYDFDED